jgi:hypothetical protein
MSATSSPRWHRPPRTLLAGLLAATVLLIATTVPGIFILDEAHQLSMVRAVAAGRLSLPQPEGLPPSAELSWFDPAAHLQIGPKSPPTPTVPPLHAFLAAPLLGLGWRGLAALNAVSLALSTLLVFMLARRYAEGDGTAWLAALAFAACGYNLEYAQGLWPHMLSVLLILLSFAAAAAVRDGVPAGWAFAAGLAAGLATGVRYQNAALVAGLAAGIAAWAPRRWSRLALFAAGACVPLAASSLINAERLGTWNPVSKGPGYLTLAVVRDGWPITDAARALLFRLVSTSFGVEVPGRPWESFDPATGMQLHGLVVKKAWFQSTPWLVAGLVALALAWWGGDRLRNALQRRELRAATLLVLALFGVFALAGVRRHDGLSYNQRYLLELVPLLALGLAWLFEALGRRARDLLPGAAVATALVVPTLLAWPMGSPDRIRLLAWAPLVLAAGLTLVLCARPLRRGPLPAHLVGAALAWAAVVHVGEDWAASRARRAEQLALTRDMAAVIPDRSLLLTYWGLKDPASLLTLDRDVVIADPWVDSGADAPRLVEAGLASGRRVFVLLNGMPPLLARGLLEGRHGRLLDSGRLRFAELFSAPRS